MGESGLPLGLLVTLSLLRAVLDDVRHDVYLTLVNGLFNKGTKRADKNVQIDVEVLDDKGQVLEVRALNLHWLSHRFTRSLSFPLSSPKQCMSRTLFPSLEQSLSYVVVYYYYSNSSLGFEPVCLNV